MINDFSINPIEILDLCKQIDSSLRKLNFMKKEKGELKRKLINKDWYIINYAIDNISYSIKAIKYCLRNGIGKKPATKYLKLYGLIGAINIQQNAIAEIYKILREDYTVKKDIIQICNRLLLQPLNSDENGFCYTINPYVDDYMVSVVEFNVDKQKEKELDPTTKYRQITVKHLKELNLCLEKFLDVYFYP